MDGSSKSVSHHFETRGNHCSLVFTGESSFQGSLGGAGFRPSTVWRLCSTYMRGTELFWGDHGNLHQVTGLH